MEWHYILLLQQLMLLVLCGIHHLLAKRGISVTPIGKAGQIRSASFRGIFFFTVLRLLAEYELQDQ
jgi:hypothetical protein